MDIQTYLAHIRPDTLARIAAEVLEDYGDEANNFDSDTAAVAYSETAFALYRLVGPRQTAELLEKAIGELS